MHAARPSQETVPESRDVLSIQYLRGIAALLVLLYHVSANRFAGQWAGMAEWGSWGVDVFFVVSGFVMWRSSLATPVAPSRFIVNRLTRIYPLYWLVLTVWIVARLVVPDSLRNADVTMASVLHSYALLPSFHPVYRDETWPILTQGWTMQLELFFYAIVAAVLVVRSVPLRATILLATLLSLAGAGYLLEPRGAIARTYTSHHLLDFAAGLGLGVIHSRLQGRSAAGLVLLLAGILVLSTRDAVLPVSASEVTGATAVVAGSLMLEQALLRRPVTALKALGDASYSLYLTHTIAIAVLATAWGRLGAGGSPAAAFPLLAVALSIAVALVSYRWLERPLLSASRRWMGRLVRGPGRPG